jgi:hypothetical protein
MDLILVTIAVLLILTIIWLIVQFKSDMRKDQQIFDDYLEQQRKVKFNRRKGKMVEKRHGFFLTNRTNKIK